MRCRYNLADFIATAATKSSYSLSLSESISSTATCTTVEFRRPEFFSAQKRDRRENVNSSMKTTHRNAHPTRHTRTRTLVWTQERTPDSTHPHPRACLEHSRRHATTTAIRHSILRGAAIQLRRHRCYSPELATHPSCTSRAPPWTGSKWCRGIERTLYIWYSFSWMQWKA